MRARRPHLLAGAGCACAAPGNGGGGGGRDEAPGNRKSLWKSGSGSGCLSGCGAPLPALPEELCPCGEAAVWVYALVGAMGEVGARGAPTSPQSGLLCSLRGGGGYRRRLLIFLPSCFVFFFFFYSLSGSRALSVLLGPDSRSLRSVKKNKNKVQESCEVLSLWFRMVTCSESLVVGYRSGKRKHAK